MKTKILPCCQLCIKYYQNICPGAIKETKEYCAKCPSRITFKTKILLFIARIIVKVRLFFQRTRLKIKSIFKKDK